MCLAIPGQIINIAGRKATIKYPNVINYALISDENVSVGDWVLVQMGIIIQKLDANEADKRISSWQSQPTTKD